MRGWRGCDASETTSRLARRWLHSVRRPAATDDNLMPYLMDAARAYATLGEMTDVLREAWGVYTELLAV